MIEKKNSKVFYLFSMLILLGSFSFIYQILRGLSITGLNEPVVWGIYVVNFTLCLSIGACILAFLSCILKRSEVSSKFKLLLSASSFISLSLAGIFILADLL